MLRSGEDVELDSGLPAPAGNSVIHYANTVHHDGAEGQETIIQVREMARRRLPRPEGTERLRPEVTYRRALWTFHD